MKKEYEVTITKIIDVVDCKDVAEAIDEAISTLYHERFCNINFDITAKVKR